MSRESAPLKKAIDRQKQQNRIAAPKGKQYGFVVVSESGLAAKQPIRIR
jgi:regulator of extracellular matrix RemA (YlzA/DUF370 family)